jgi:FkbM family methyltransferase
MYYSQDNQDKFLNEKIFKGYKNGFFIDIGAHDGKSINNTLFFEENHNWRGINVEPIKEVFNKLVINRPNCININYAVCNEEGETDFLQNTGYTEMISGLKKTFNPKHYKRLEKENKKFGGKTQIIKVKTKKLSSICKEYNIKHVNYLSIDVEGAEFEVIKSIDFDNLFIDVIGFENNYENMSIPIINFLKKKKFKVIHKSLDIIMINNNSKFCQ